MSRAGKTTWFLWKHPQITINVWHCKHQKSWTKNNIANSKTNTVIFHTYRNCQFEERVTIPLPLSFVWSEHCQDTFLECSSFQCVTETVCCLQSCVASTARSSRMTHSAVFLCRHRHLLTETSCTIFWLERTAIN